MEVQQLEWELWVIEAHASGRPTAGVRAYAACDQ